MSFTSIVKNELSKLELSKLEATTELSAILKNNSQIDDNSIKVTTENSSVARHIFNLIKDIYNISPKITVRHGFNYNKNYIYILEIKEKLELIIKDLSLDTNIPNDYIIDDDVLLRIYLRGLFISSGSINDPKKSRYHLEFVVDNQEYAEFIKEKLNVYFLNSKVIKRDNRFMIYVKEAEKIGDFLRMINAISALLYYEDIRIYRDHKNMTNRLNNCEQANVDKIIETANNQVKDIELIESIGGMELLDEKTKVAAIYRIKYKEASLLELSEIISVETGAPITKSGLHHRFTKIKELAKRIRDKKNI
ncbi:MAG: DNA-binding protein WhiA [Bacilli bacterium]|nr:DNA-binding protein WhiA [Bacilli bacterium]